CAQTPLTGFSMCPLSAWINRYNTDTQKNTSNILITPENLQGLRAQLATIVSPESYTRNLEWLKEQWTAFNA
ncbi:hypothetical protein COB21_05505, partial [Candidatus Aerophobetes bacterium]